MSKQNKKLSIRTILTVLTLILVGIVVWQNYADIVEAITHLGDTNIFVMLILIPEQLFMYYCCGQIFFSYMQAKKGCQPISQWSLMRISLELNFVNHAVPAGGFGGLGYITWRLLPFGSTAGQTSFMYALRYIITVIANQIQTIIAIVFMLLAGAIPASGAWVIAVTMIISLGIVAGIMVIIVIASNLKRIHKFAKFATSFGNKFISTVTFGRKKQLLSYEKIDKYLTDIHENLMVARRNKKILIKPIVWGFIYSFLEIAVYWIVAMSLGHPELLPQIMIGEAIGSVLGAIVPYGLYELGMAGVMAQLGVEVGLATLVVVIARVVVLGSTIISGYGFYQHSISTIGKKAQKEYMENAGD